MTLHMTVCHIHIYILSGLALGVFEAEVLSEAVLLLGSDGFFQYMYLLSKR